MAEVGILNLKITSDTSEAENGLGRLADALSRIKTAVQEAKIGSVSSQIRKLVKTINEEVNESTITKLQSLTDSLSKLQGLGDIRINFRNSNEITRAVESVETALQGIQDTPERGLDEGFATAEKSIQEVNSDLQEVGTTMQTLEDIVHNTNWAAQFDPSKLPIGSLGTKMDKESQEWYKYGAAVKETFEAVQQLASVKMSERFGEADWKPDFVMVDNAEVNEGTKTFNNIREAADAAGITVREAVKQMRENLARLNEASTARSEYDDLAKAYGTNLDDVLKGMTFNDDGTIQFKSAAAAAQYYCTTLEELNEKIVDVGQSQHALTTTDLAEMMSDGVEETETRIDLLRQKMALLQEEVESGHTEKGTELSEKDIINRKLQIDSITTQIEKLEEKARNAQAALDGIQNAQNAEPITYGEEMVENMSNYYTTIDLMTMKLNGMKQALADDINANKLDTEQIAARMLTINSLQEKIDKLTSSQEKAEDSTRGLSGAYESLKEKIASVIPLSGLMEKVWSRFKQTVLRRSITALVRSLWAGLKEGVENVREYSNAVGTSFGPAMESASNSIQLLKNSIGASLSPVLQAIIPILNSITSAVITVINWINQLFSLLSGQTTWTHAIDASADALDDVASSAGGASSAVKDLLADWDELNIIQSESGSGGGGGSTNTDTDYSSMFEELDQFNEKIKAVADFIKENMETIKKIATDIGVAILAWRLSNAFTGWISKLATLATIGIIMKLSFDTSQLLDNAYIESNDVGFLVGDLVLTGALAGIAGKLAEAKFGNGAGLITAGLTFAVSAAATFDVARNAEDEAQKHMLELFGGVEMGIGAALASAGFIAAGINPALSIVGGTLLVGLTTLITLTLAMEAEAAENAKEMAHKAFAETGDGGINAAEYLTALQEEFDRQTAGAQLVIDAYVSVPSLREKLDEAASQISSFNYIVFKGEGKLSEDDAEAFKKNWKTVLDTLSEMNKNEYTTILQGLTTALSSKSAELRKSAEEIRTTFIMLNKNISAENAEIWKNMEDLVNKISAGDTSEETLSQYESYYRVFAAATRTGLEEVEEAIEKGKNIDFGDAEHAVENAQNFVKDVSNAAAEALKTEQDALNDVKSSVSSMRRTETAKYNEGIITKDEYEERMKALDDVVNVATKYYQEKEAEITEKAQEAWNKVFEQAVGTDDLTQTYWKEVLNPLMEEAKKQGYEIPESVYKAFAEGIGSATTIMDFYKSPTDWVDELKDKSVDEIVGELNRGIEKELGKAQDNNIWNSVLNLMGWNENNLGLTEVDIDAKKLLGISGFDLWAEDVKKSFMKALREAVGDVKASAVAEKLGFDYSSIITTDPAEISKVVKDTVDDIKKGVKKLTDNYSQGNGFNILNWLGFGNGGADSTSDVTSGVEEATEAVMSYEEALESLRKIVNSGTFSIEDMGIVENIKKTFGVEEYAKMREELMEEMMNADEVSSNEMQMDMSGVIEPVQETMDLFEQYKEEIEQIKKIMNSGTFDFSEMDVIENIKKKIGIENYSKIMDQLMTDSAWNTSGSTNIPNVRRVSGDMAFAGAASGVQFAPYNPSAPQGTQTEVKVQDISGDVQRGVQSGSTWQVSLLQQLVSLCSQIAAKDFSVTVSPSADWGFHNQRSGDSASYVTGDIGR